MMRERSVVKAKPPPTMTMFFPSRYSMGQEFPRGPRSPIRVPSSISWRAEVTTPAFWTVNSTYPFWVGEDAIPMGDSPLPKMDNSPNWPGMYRNFSSSSLLRKAKRKVLMSLVSTSVTILITSTG